MLGTKLVEQAEIRRPPKASLGLAMGIPMASRVLQAPLEAQIGAAAVQPLPQSRPGLNQGFMGELQRFAAVLAAGAGDQAHGRAGEALNHAPHRR